MDRVSQAKDGLGGMDSLHSEEAEVIPSTSTDSTPSKLSLHDIIKKTSGKVSQRPPTQLIPMKKDPLHKRILKATGQYAKGMALPLAETAFNAVNVGALTAASVATPNPATIAGAALAGYQTKDAIKKTHEAYKTVKAARQHEKNQALWGHARQNLDYVRENGATVSSQPLSPSPSMKQQPPKKLPWYKRAYHSVKDTLTKAKDYVKSKFSKKTEPVVAAVPATQPGEIALKPMKKDPWYKRWYKRAKDYTKGMAVPVAETAFNAINTGALTAASVATPNPATVAGAALAAYQTKDAIKKTHEAYKTVKAARKSDKNKARWGHA